MRPLADEIRPQTLDEVCGQRHLLGEGAAAAAYRERHGHQPDLLRPSGTGKTTVANIIAKRAEKTLYYLNATTASLQDVKISSWRCGHHARPQRRAAVFGRDPVLQ